MRGVLFVFCILALGLARPLTAESGHGAGPSYDTGSDSGSAFDESAHSSSEPEAAEGEPFAGYEHILNQWQTDLESRYGQSAAPVVSKIVITKRTVATTRTLAPSSAPKVAYQSPAEGKRTLENAPVVPAFIAQTTPVPPITINILNRATEPGPTLLDPKVNVVPEKKIPERMQKPVTAQLLWNSPQFGNPPAVSRSAVPGASKNYWVRFSSLINFLRNRPANLSLPASKLAAVSAGGLPIAKLASRGLASHPSAMALGGVGDTINWESAADTLSAQDCSEWFTWLGWLFALFLLTMLVRSERQRRQR